MVLSVLASAISDHAQVSLPYGRLPSSAVFTTSTFNTGPAFVTPGTAANAVRSMLYGVAIVASLATKGGHGQTDVYMVCAVGGFSDGNLPQGNAHGGSPLAICTNDTALAAWTDAIPPYATPTAANNNTRQQLYGVAGYTVMLDPVGLALTAIWVAVGQDVGSGPAIISWVSGGPAISATAGIQSWFQQDLSRVIVVPEDCSAGCALFASTANPFSAPQYGNPNNAGSVAPGKVNANGYYSDPSPYGGVITSIIGPMPTGALPPNQLYFPTVQGFNVVDVCAPNTRVPVDDTILQGVPPAAIYNLGANATTASLQGSAQAPPYYGGRRMLLPHDDEVTADR